MYIGRLTYKSDLLRELNKFAAAQGIKAGIIQVLGSLSRARLSFYDQKIHAYHELDFDAPHEIVSGTGNISIRDDAPFVHLHLSVANSEGLVRGGHCLEGCTVFAVEFAIWPFQGEAPHRIRDTKNDTGLLLWEEPFYKDSSQ